MNVKEMIERQVSDWGRLGHPGLMDRFILKRGVEFASGEHRPYRRAVARACFMNATHYVQKHPDAEYYEGYVVPENLGIPILHAWNVVDGKVIDVTLDRAATCRYFGVHFERELHLEEMLRNGVYGVLDPGCGINADLIKRLEPALFEEAMSMAKGFHL